jgi:monofunctional biosynthetic peptidoglycan transglycosylase
MAPSDQTAGALPRPRKTARAKPRRARSRLWLKLFVWLTILAVAVPIAWTALYRVVPPPATILMIERLAQGYGLHKHWKPISQIAPSLAQAVIAAEDTGFCEHQGFDFEAMQAAYAANEKGSGPVRGGSTISQQTAKNVFLWPDRSYLRKGAEAYFTVLIEHLWGKRRILEMYLNVVEWGPGTYGAEAAAQRYFHTSAAKLTPAQSARLAAILPSPLKWKAVRPGPYVARRSRKIGARAVTVREDDLAACVRR